MTKKKIKFILVLPCIFILGYYCYHKASGRRLDSPETSLQAPFEIEPKYFITSKEDVFYSGHSSGNYAIYQNNDLKPVGLNSTGSDVFFPFEFENKICGLRDQDGDENFKTTNDTLNKILNYRSIKSIFSFKAGALIFVKLNNDNIIYEIKNRTVNKIPNLIDVKHLETILYDEKRNSVLLSCDNKLILSSLDPKIAPLTLVDESTSVEEVKFNPFIVNDDLYFSSNESSEFYQIFKTDLRNPFKKRELIYKSDHDVRMPKVSGSNLFYLEVVNSQYLLKQCNLKTKSITSITSKGVVYYYDLFKNALIYSYSDFTTPKCLIKYNNKSNLTIYITGKSLPVNVSAKLIAPSSTISKAYIIDPPKKRTAQGVILFFHPGLHSDFSPRWEPILTNLARNGYVIVAPNYRMSSGYGKSFYAANLKSTLIDISLWKRYIKLNYPDQSLYYLSSSSGNILMEKTLLNDNQYVMATCSIFGIPAVDVPDFPQPSLYLLGKNDPIINYSIRFQNLKQAEINNNKISVITYKDEGHWIRKPLNSNDAIHAIQTEFMNNK